MKLLKAIVIQLGMWVSVGFIIIIFFIVVGIVMEYILKPIVDWMGVGYGLGAGLILIFGGGLIIFLIYCFVACVISTYKNFSCGKN